MTHYLPEDFRRLSLSSHRHSSERLALRPLSLDDFTPLFDATRYAAFNRNLLWSAPASAQELKQRVATMTAQADAGAYAAVSTVKRDTGDWVGLIRFMPSALPTPSSRAVEGGVWLHPHYWHGRYSCEATRLMVKTAFVEFPDLELFTARISKKNQAAVKLAERVGFSVTGEASTRCEDGRPMDIWLFAIARAEVNFATEVQDATGLV